MGKRGEPVNVKVQQGYKSFYSYSCVSPHSGESFSLLLPEVNTDMMNIYLDEFSKEYSNKDILIILDQAGWHKAKDLKIPENTALMFLPPYSPELNPVEKLWHWLRKEVTHNSLFKTLEELMDGLEKEFQKESVSFCCVSEKVIDSFKYEDCPNSNYLGKRSGCYCNKVICNISCS
jgi:transposase